MKNTSLIAILMATYNGEKFIKEQIDSILQQTNSDWCLFINDDGSFDKTISIIKEFQDRYPSKIYLLEFQSKGLGATRNFMTLLENVESKYYMFSDQDDVWLPTKIQRSLAEMNSAAKHSKLMPIIIHTDLTVVDASLNIVASSFYKYRNVNPEKYISFNYLGIANAVTGCTMLFNDEAKQITLKSGVELHWHDWTIAVNVSKFGKIQYLNESTIYYRQHQNNTIGGQKANLKSFLSTILKYHNVILFDFNNYKKVRQLGYGNAFKYILFKMLFQIRRYV